VIKGFKQIAGLTMLSRVFGMVRDMAYSHFFGAGWVMTAWTVGFMIPNLSRRLFGEGAASASLIPVYSEQLHSNPPQAKRLADTMITFISVILAAAVIIIQILLWGYYFLFETRTGPKLGILLCSIMLPYAIFICIVAIISGILNVHKHFATPAAAPIVLNIFVIGTILLTGRIVGIKPQTQAIFVAIAVLLSGLAQLALQIPSLRASGVSIRPDWDIHSAAFKKVFLLMGPMALGLAVTQINTLADYVIALAFGNKQGRPLTENAISYLYYAQRLYQLPLGVLGISLATAIFPVMSDNAAKKDFTALSGTIIRGLKSAIFIALPATAGLFLVGKPLIAVLLQHGEFRSEDTPVVAFVLSFYALGLCGYFSQQVLARACYSLQDTMTPVKSGLIAVGANVILNLSLIWLLGAAGLAASTALCSYLQVMILLFVLKKKIGSALANGLLHCLIKTIAATIVMLVAGIVIMTLMKYFPDTRRYNVLRLALVVPIASVIFFAASKLLKIEELSLFARGKKHKQSIAV
jgi:putative peptidoglycan lipid II flippase